ncbi:MAG: hypothetical protein IAG10_00845 [Planctomycetaceae bacterium]|nr:hypothetical protein [Planctomycetaceae bacterium]
MTQILVDREMRDKMLRSLDGAEFVDDTGTVVGSYVPPLPPSYAPKWMPPPLSAEELERALSGPRYSTEEVLEHLRSL